MSDTIHEQAPGKERVTLRLAGMPQLGYVSTAFLVLTDVLAAVLRSAATHVSAPERKSPIVAAPTEAVV